MENILAHRTTYYWLDEAFTLSSQSEEEHVHALDSTGNAQGSTLSEKEGLHVPQVALKKEQAAKAVFSTLVALLRHAHERFKSQTSGACLPAGSRNIQTARTTKERKEDEDSGGGLPTQEGVRDVEVIKRQETGKKMHHLTQAWTAGCAVVDGHKETSGLSMRLLRS